MTRILGLTNAFADRRIVVFGDVMLDRFHYGTATRISPEAPIPVFRGERLDVVLGGAGNTARNVASLSGQARLVGLIGEDQMGDAVIETARAQTGLKPHLIREAGRNTIVKTRLVARGQQLLRVDEEPGDPVGEATAERLLDALDQALDGADMLILSDYLKGVLTPKTIAGAVERAHAKGARVLLDPKSRDLRRYAGVDVITPNTREAELLSGVSCDDDEGCITAARTISEALGGAIVVLTRGARGMTVVSRESGEETVVHLPTEAQEVFDVSGAGDTVVASLALALAAGAPTADAAHLANIAAGLSVGKVGTAVVGPEELDNAVQRSVLREGGHKIVSRDAAANAARMWREDGRSVVFTNGCFDIFHPGHVSLIRQAAAMGDRLVVALNSDASVKRLKGESRPIQDEAARAEIMSAMTGVDLVVIFDEDTPYEAIKAIQPDILVKGADYAPDEVVGADIVEARGGAVRLVNLEPGYSTSAAVERASQGR